MSLKRGPPALDKNNNNNNAANAQAHDHSHRPPKTTKLHHPTPAAAAAAAQPPSSQIYRSAPLTDRHSTFHAYFTPHLSPSHPPAAALQAHPDFRTATHRIAAWRRPSTQRTLFSSSSSTNISNKNKNDAKNTNAVLYQTSFDDDGESHAGRRLAAVLEALDVREGVVVVARWYGGVMLGPVRFEHVERCAREAVGRWRAAVEKEKEGDGGEEEKEKEKGRLVGVLRERDGSVEVLRGLLAGKKRALGGGEDGGGGGTEVGKKRMEYERMPVQALVRLEKARDATIAFVLKELDKVEEEILKGMGGGGEELDGEDEVAHTEAADALRNDGKDGEAVGSRVADDVRSTDKEEMSAENENQCDPVVDDESCTRNPNSDAG
ncbi:protein impact [Diplodia corticola]|uniref:Protein impact n=1 Tax=Diplodia corticola TaxID=236234 RepID=A0A1J9SEE2_9PEZI|nr:protein impact [Diplodia corticola]OJD38791.1 protein impact [Diplodia corticola]